MQLTHRFRFPAPLDQTWATFARLDQIAPCFPGAVVDSSDGTAYQGFVKIKFGPVPLIYRGTAHYAELDEAARRMVVTAHAADQRRSSDAAATVTAVFTAAGAATDVRVETDLAITGRPAQFGKGVIGDVSDKLLDQFVDRASEKFRAGTFQLAAPAAAADAAAPAGEADAAAAADDDPAGSTAGSGGGAGSDAGASPSPTAKANPYQYTAPSDSAAPDFDAFATVVPVLLKRGWPVLLGGAVLAVIVRAILRRR